MYLGKIYRVTKKEWTPLSCKFDLFLTILDKSNEIISYWLGLDKSFAVFQIPGYEHSSLDLPKMIKNRSNLHKRGVHSFFVTL